MNVRALRAQEIAAAYKRGLKDQRQALAAELRAEINYAYDDGRHAMRKRGGVLILVASLVSFGAGAWFF